MNELRYKPVPGMPPVAIHDQLPLTNKTGTWRSLRPVYQTKLAPCRQGCPAGVDIPAYFALVKQDRLAEAWALITQDNPLPAVCGRVCYHPCEESCNRQHFDEALSINTVERFVGDFGLSLSPTKRPSTMSAGKVAVVGSGPAGLTCAYHLARMDYAVTIFETAAVPGGMLTLGIPEYRLPRDVLKAEIAAIEASGVEIVTNAAIGPQRPISQLREQGYQAVFLAIGAHGATAPQLPGAEDSDVVMAIDFLRQINTAHRPVVGRRVAVIGGGNVAIDAARSALRLGASEVIILYRRSREEMPAHTSEIAAAEAEGIRFNYLVTPVSLTKNGRVTGLRCVRTELGDRDTSGRRTAIAIPGSDFALSTDTLIMATGQRPASDYFATEDIRLNDDGTIFTNSATLATSRAAVFAGGDAITGPARVVDAIAAGKLAAQSIHRYLAGQPDPISPAPAPVATFESLNLDYFEHAPRVRPGAAGSRSLTSDVETTSERGIEAEARGFTPAETLAEIERCFSCGWCNACDNCWLFCPDLAVSRQGEDYHIDYDYCKGCGICATECPRSAISVEEEAK